MTIRLNPLQLPFFEAIKSFDANITISGNFVLNVKNSNSTTHSVAHLHALGHTFQTGVPPMLAVADLRGREGRAPPGGPKFFQFHAVFGKIWQIVCWRPTWGVGAPSSGKSWIHHWLACVKVHGSKRLGIILIDGFKGVQGTRAPSQSNFFHFYAVFGKNLAK